MSASGDPGAPSSHYVADVSTTQIASLKKEFGYGPPGRSPQVSAPETPPAETSIVPFFALTLVLQVVTACATGVRNARRPNASATEPIRNLIFRPPACPL